MGGGEAKKLESQQGREREREREGGGARGICLRVCMGWFMCAVCVHVCLYWPCADTAIPVNSCEVQQAWPQQFQ